MSGFMPQRDDFRMGGLRVVYSPSLERGYFHEGNILYVSEAVYRQLHRTFIARVTLPKSSYTLEAIAALWPSVERAGEQEEASDAR